MRRLCLIGSDVRRAGPMSGCSEAVAELLPAPGLGASCATTLFERFGTWRNQSGPSAKQA